MLFCTNCGNKIEPGANFCIACGTPVKKVTEPVIRKVTGSKEGSGTEEGRKISERGAKPSKPKKVTRAPLRASFTQKVKQVGSGKILTRAIALIVVVAVIYFWSGWLVGLFSGNKEVTNTGQSVVKSAVNQSSNNTVVEAKTKKVLAEQLVNTDTINVEIKAAENVTVLLPIGLFDGEKTLVVKELEQISLPFDGRKCTRVLDLTLGDLHEFDDFVEIQVDPPAGFDTQKGIVQCFSQNGSKWEQVLAFYDPKIGKVRTYTNHFTMFAYTYQTLKLLHNPMMQVPAETVNLWGRLTSSAETKLLEGYDASRIMQQQSDDYLLACWNSAMELYGLSGTGLSFAENVLDIADLEAFNNYVGNIGYGLALVNAAMDLQRGNTQKAVLETLKNTYNFGASKIMNSRALNIAFIGVFAIDYSLTAFANEAWDGRRRLYRAVFDNFNYYQRTKEGKNLRWWKKEIYWRMADAKDPSKFEKVVENLIQEYIKNFWDTDIERAIIQAELQKHGWTYNGGYSEKLKDELNPEFRLYILQYIQPVIERMQLNYLLEAKIKIQEDAAKLADLLNQEHTIHCTVELGEGQKPEAYKGYKVAFKNANQTIRKMWEGFLDENASLDFNCTYAGYLDARIPPKAILYIPVPGRKDEFEEVEQSFSLNPQESKTELVFVLEEELLDGPWEVSEYESAELFSFMSDIVDRIGASGEKNQQIDEKQAAQRRSAIRKLNEEYRKAKEAGIVSAPTAVYEKGEELLYLNQYHPRKEGELYLFTINLDDCETKVLLDLKSKNYFEAKMFTVCEGFVWIDYAKGELKN